MKFKVNQWISDDGALVDRRIFSDADIYQREKKKIFNTCWLFLCHESQLREPGDFFTTYMGEAPIIVSRHKDGEIYAYINSCRHRGLRVCRADSGNTNSHTCPYHGWTYGNDGQLIGMPRKKDYYPDLDVSEWGLVQARVDIYCGLVFGTFNREGMGLEEYLGDARFYMDTLLDRSEGGMEVLGGVQKWEANTNWKMPSENMVGDTYHALRSHRSVFSMQANAAAAYDSIERGFNISMKGGHGSICRYFEEGTDPDSWLPGEAAILELYPDMAKFLREQQAEAEQRLGPIKLRTKPAASTVFPNFHLLSTVFCIRIAHPKGPTKSELWNWIIVPKSWPQEFKQVMIDSYYMAFGPGGMLEQDDIENWEQVTAGSIGEEISNYPFHFGQGLHQGKPHADIPGLVDSARNEMPQREMYRHWQNLMNKED